MNAVIENFHFLRPLWLLALLPVLWLFFSAWKTQNQASEWQSEIAPHLLPWLVEGSQSASSKLPWYLLLLLWVLAVFALAGPTWEKLPQPLKKDSSALVVLFDLSPSMNVKDVAPSRLVRARLKLIDLLDTRKEGLTALVAYAGEAHVVTPLTDDVDTIKNLVPSLSPQTMPVPGSNAEMAMELANRLLKDAGIALGNIVFITDGIAPAALPELKKLQRAYGHKVSVWGFGTAQGAPIQLTDGGFARNNSGEIVVAKLDSEQLSDAAVAMNGVYIPFTDTRSDIDTINDFGISPFNQQQREVEREFDQWVEFGPWLILFALPLVALSFRRGLILSLMLVVFMQQSPPVFAQQELPIVEKQAQDQPQDDSSNDLWGKLWLTPNQRAQRALDAGDAERAAELFTHPERKGVANFRAQNFEQAAELFKQSEDSPEKWFNQGTALTHAGKYDEALAAYDKALALQPEFPQAQNNRNITETLKQLEEQQQNNQDSQQNQDQNQQDQNQQQQNQRSQSQQSESQQDSSQQNSDQQQSDQQQSDQKSAQEDDSQQDMEQQQQNASSAADQEKAREDFEKQLADAQEQQDQQQEQQEQARQQLHEQQTQEEQEAEQTQQQAYIDPDQLAESEDQQKLEQLLRRVPDDPGRLLRNKFRYEAQQRRLEVDTNKWNTLENSEEERW